MLAMPWVPLSKALPERDYLVLLSHLPLRRYRKMPTFFRYVSAIRRQLQATEGVVGYSLLAQPMRRQFWTLSAWEDGDALSAFVRAKPHREVMAALRGHMGPTTFVKWHVQGALLPPKWPEAMERFQKEKNADDAANSA